MLISDASELVDGIHKVLAHEGPILCDIRVTQNEALWPKVAAVLNRTAACCRCRWRT